MSASAAVVVDSLNKRFRRPSRQVHTLKERLLHPRATRGEEHLEALRGVSFAVERGEFFGIVGRNGSGKSTLLKCLTGIYASDSGRMWIDGRVAAFIELGVGFNMDLAARDNIRLNGVMQGLSVKEARRREDEIIAFAGLEEFVDLKIKNYSSGMLVRLGFSIMAHVDADVLIIDEVLAVGDAAFQQKCYDEFNRIRDAGRTVLFVTHDMGAVERYCDRALLLDRGEIVQVGDPHRVGQEYLRINFAEEAPDVGGEDGGPPDEAGGDEGEPADPDRFGDGRAEITRAWFEDESGNPAATIPHGERCAFVAQVKMNAALEDPLFGVVLHNDRDETVLACSSHWVRERTGTFTPGQELTYRITFENVFSPGRYKATPAVAHRGAGIAWIDRREKFVSMVVTATRTTDAAVILPYEIEISD
jgi:ABC-type polysaccharide/polyol phosphate transport system ATPase subunit